MRYADLVGFYERLDATTGRLEMTDILVELFHACDKDEVKSIVYLTQGKVAPDFSGVELGVAEKLVVRVLAQVTGLPESNVTSLSHQFGDLGDVAADLMGAEGPKGARQATLFSPVGGDVGGDLTVREVHQGLLEMAAAQGRGSQEVKQGVLARLLLGMDAREARYLVRTVTGRLRLGVADMTLLDALATAFATKEDRARLERGYNVASDLGLVAETLVNDGMDAVDKLRLKVGVPVRAMLAERLPDASAILEKLGGAGAVEWKYDGLRLQAHIEAVREDRRESPDLRSGRIPAGDKPVHFFTRRLEDVTPQFPDVADALRAAFQGKEAIVEGEAVPIDLETGAILPFQEITRRRGRKHDLQQAMEAVPVAIVLFDVLLLDGDDVTSLPLPERRARLEAAFDATDRVWFSHYEVVDDPERLESLFAESVEEGSEGIMVKSVAEDSGYRAGSRGWQWIKFKRDYQASLSDSLDLVVVGAFHGRGRRKGWYGALLMAAYDHDEDVFETVCKLGTGFSDEALAHITETFRATTIPHRHARVKSRLEADVWFEPKVVGEVRGAELTVSPVHTAALGRYKRDAGLALRFPRFTGTWRDDKAPEDATTVEEVAAMYEAQRRP